MKLRVHPVLVAMAVGVAVGVIITGCIKLLGGLPL